MVIERKIKEDEKNFGDLERGDSFDYCERYYIKIDDVTTYGLTRVDGNAICLKDGELHHFGKDYKVRIEKMKLVVGEDE